MSEGQPFTTDTRTPGEKELLAWLDAYSKAVLTPVALRRLDDNLGRGRTPTRRWSSITDRLRQVEGARDAVQAQGDHEYSAFYNHALATIEAIEHSGGDVIAAIGHVLVRFNKALSQANKSLLEQAMRILHPMYVCPGDEQGGHKHDGWKPRSEPPRV